MFEAIWTTNEWTKAQKVVDTQVVYWPVCRSIDQRKFTKKIRRHPTGFQNSQHVQKPPWTKLAHLQMQMQLSWCRSRTTPRLANTKKREHGNRSYADAYPNESSQAIPGESRAGHNSVTDKKKPAPRWQWNKSLKDLFHSPLRTTCRWGWHIVTSGPFDHLHVSATLGCQ